MVLHHAAQRHIGRNKNFLWRQKAWLGIGSRNGENQEYRMANVDLSRFKGGNLFVADQSIRPQSGKYKG